MKPKLEVGFSSDCVGLMKSKLLEVYFSSSYTGSDYGLMKSKLLEVWTGSTFYSDYIKLKLEAG
jgi:hypothetical protein